jgi:hypothetical protein
MHNIRRDPIDVPAELMQFRRRSRGGSFSRQSKRIDWGLEPEEWFIGEQGQDVVVDTEVLTGEQIGEHSLCTALPQAWNNV